MDKNKDSTQPFETTQDNSPIPDETLASENTPVIKEPSDTDTLPIAEETATAEEILATDPDGLILSNGPGDPSENVFCIEQIKKLLLLIFREETGLSRIDVLEGPARQTA